MPATAAMPPARIDRTAESAIERVTREERPVGLHVTIGERCGDALIEAYRRVRLAYYEAK